MTRDGSLFRGEEQVIAAAEGLLARGCDTLPAQEFATLLAHYEKLHRQSMRLVKMGDHMQGQLCEADALTSSDLEERKEAFKELERGEALDLHEAMRQW